MLQASSAFTVVDAASEVSVRDWTDEDEDQRIEICPFASVSHYFAVITLLTRLGKNAGHAVVDGAKRHENTAIQSV